MWNHDSPCWTTVVYYSGTLSKKKIRKEKRKDKETKNHTYKNIFPMSRYYN